MASRDSDDLDVQRIRQEDVEILPRDRHVRRTPRRRMLARALTGAVGPALIDTNPIDLAPDAELPGHDAGVSFNPDIHVPVVITRGTIGQGQILRAREYDGFYVAEGKGCDPNPFCIQVLGMVDKLPIPSATVTIIWPAAFPHADFVGTTDVDGKVCPLVSDIPTSYTGYFPYFKVRVAFGSCSQEITVSFGVATCRTGLLPIYACFVVFTVNVDFVPDAILSTSITIPIPITSSVMTVPYCGLSLPPAPSRPTTVKFVETAPGYCGTCIVVPFVCADTTVTMPALYSYDLKFIKPTEFLFWTGGCPAYPCGVPAVPEGCALWAKKLIVTISCGAMGTDSGVPITCIYQGILTGSNGASYYHWQAIRGGNGTSIECYNNFFPGPAPTGVQDLLHPTFQPSISSQLNVVVGFEPDPVYGTIPVARVDYTVFYQSPCYPQFSHENITMRYYGFGFDDDMVHLCYPADVNMVYSTYPLCTLHIQDDIS